MAFVITKFNKAKDMEEENRQAENEIKRLNRNLEAQSKLKYYLLLISV